MEKYYRIFLRLILLAMIFGSASASSPRVSLVESYTSPYFTSCAEQNPKFYSDLAALGNKVVPMVLFVPVNGKPLDSITAYDNTLYNRIGLYVSSSFNIPVDYVNGSKHDLPTVTADVTPYSSMTSPYTIYVVEKKYSDSTVASIVVHSDVAVGSDKLLYVAVIEKHIVHPNLGDNGETDFYWVTRKIFAGPQTGYNIAMGSGQSKTIIFSIPYDPVWNKDSVHIIAFIQDKNTDEVLQAAMTTTEQEVEPEIAFNETTLFFPGVSTSDTSSITVTNNGILPLFITDLAFESNKDSVFEILSKTPIILTYKMSAKINVKFTPKQNKSYNTTLKITSNASNGGVKSISVIGTGSGVVEKPNIALSTRTLKFGNVSTATTKSFKVTNNGYANLIIGTVSIENDQKGAFKVVPQTYNPIKPDSSVDIEVTFTPMKNISYVGTVRITANTVSSATVDLEGTGEGVVAQNPEISIDKATLDFGEVSTNKTLDVVITNSGKGNLVIDSINIISDVQNVFRRVSDIPGPIAEGATATVSVIFKPPYDDDFSGFLMIKSNANESPSKSVLLMGTGYDVKDVPAIAFLSSEVDFGFVETNYEGTQTLTIRNSGSGPLQISDLKIVNDNDNAFQITSATTVDPISPDQTHTVHLKFAPKEKKAFTGGFFLKSNTGADGSLEDFTIPLKGTSIETGIVNDLKENSSVLALELTPNPVNGSSALNYFLGTTSESLINIAIYDNSGKLVKELFNSVVAPGSYTMALRSEGLPSGSCYIMATAAGYKAVQQVIILK